MKCNLFNMNSTLLATPAVTSGSGMNVQTEVQGLGLC